MIPALATMVGAYIATRMIELILREAERRETSTFLVGMATLTIVIVVIGLIVVWTNEREAARALSDLDLLR